VEEKWRREEEERNVTQKAGNDAAASFYGPGWRITRIKESEQSKTP
jgi:hypothetical protein